METAKNSKKLVINGKKISDNFKANGKIEYMHLKVKSNEMGNKMKMKIGETILTDEELIDNNCALQPDGEIHFNSIYMEHATGKPFIEVKKDDVFEFEQSSENVSEINLQFAN